VIVIAFNFVAPLCRIVFRFQIAAAIVAMPKATINEYGQLRLWKNEIWFSQQWKITPPSMHPPHAKQ